MRKNLFDDQSDYLQLSQADETTFYLFSLDSVRSSSWNKFPTPEKPDIKFKYASIKIYLHKDISIHSRQTYSLLDFLGDLGGLFDALRLIIAALVSPFSALALKVSILSKLYIRPNV